MRHLVFGLTIAGLAALATMGPCEPAQAAPPAAPIPPPEAERYFRHTVRWEVACPPEFGEAVDCWAYVAVRKKPCELADIDGSGSVGAGDLMVLYEQWGKTCGVPVVEEPSE